jgi:hypothetical protein
VTTHIALQLDAKGGNLVVLSNPDTGVFGRAGIDIVTVAAVNDGFF